MSAVTVAIQSSEIHERCLTSSEHCVEEETKKDNLKDK